MRVPRTRTRAPTGAATLRCCRRTGPSLTRRCVAKRQAPNPPPPPPSSFLLAMRRSVRHRGAYYLESQTKSSESVTPVRSSAAQDLYRQTRRRCAGCWHLPRASWPGDLHHCLNPWIFDPSNILFNPPRSAESPVRGPKSAASACLVRVMLHRRHASESLCACVAR